MPSNTAISVLISSAAALYSASSWFSKAVAMVKNGDRLHFGLGCGSIIDIDKAIAKRADELRDITVISTFKKITTLGKKIFLFFYGIFFYANFALR